jgi:hypothetical protein
MFRTKSAVRNWIRTLEEIRFLVRLKVVGSRTLGILWLFFRIYRRYVTIKGGLPKENFPVSLQWLNLQYSYFSPDRLLLKRKKLHPFLIKKREKHKPFFFPKITTLFTVYVPKGYDTGIFAADLAAWSACARRCVCVRARDRERERETESERET